MLPGLSSSKHRLSRSRRFAGRVSSSWPIYSLERFWVVHSWRKGKGPLRLGAPEVQVPCLLAASNYLPLVGAFMKRKLSPRRRLPEILLLALIFWTGQPASAGLLFGDYAAERQGCDRGAYPRWHYWIPTLYRWHSYCHPQSLDQYAPGPWPPVSPSYDWERFRCPSGTGAAQSPYQNPEEYFGR